MADPIPCVPSSLPRVKSPPSAKHDLRAPARAAVGRRVGAGARLADQPHAAARGNSGAGRRRLVVPVPRQAARWPRCEDEADELPPIMALLRGAGLQATLSARPTSAACSSCTGAGTPCRREGHRGLLTAPTTSSTAPMQALAGNRWLDRATDDLRRFVRCCGRQLHWPGRIEVADQRAPQLLDAFAARRPRAESVACTTT